MLSETKSELLKSMNIKNVEINKDYYRIIELDNHVRPVIFKCGSGGCFYFRYVAACMIGNYKTWAMKELKISLKDSCFINILSTLSQEQVNNFITEHDQNLNN